MTALPTLPALVVGDVTHRRAGAVRRRFRHRVYQWLVDLDAVPVQPRYLRPLAAFRSADHLGDPGRSLKQNIETYLAGNGIELGPGGRVIMLAHARVLGHVFDPLTVFWCFAADGRLACIVAEVHNTYGERHAYLLHPDAAGSARAQKRFYVSPFLTVDRGYLLRFQLRPDQVGVSVALRQNGAVAFSAAFRGVPRPASRRALIGQFLRRPLVPQRVSLLIRAHGVRLWLRGLPVTPRRPRLSAGPR